MSLIEDLVNDYRSEALHRDKVAQADYLRRWRKIEDTLKDKVDALILEIRALSAAGDPVPDYKVFQLSRYQALISQAQDEIFRFMRYASSDISHLQQKAAQDGLDLGVRSIQKELGIDVSWARLNIEAVQAMFGYAQNGAPLYELLMADYPKTVVQLTDALTRGVALGQNPRVTARNMFNAMGGNLQRAFTIARTEQLRALRYSQLSEYRNSGYVQEFQRIASKSTRTCLACLLEDGRIYKIDEEMSDHPNGRCMFVVRNPARANDRLNGKEYFLSLSEAQQRAIMGNERFTAWQTGEVALDQMSRMHNHPIWGEAPRVVPMKELRDANG